MALGIMVLIPGAQMEPSMVLKTGAMKIAITDLDGVVILTPAGLYQRIMRIGLLIKQ